MPSASFCCRTLSAVANAASLTSRCSCASCANWPARTRFNVRRSAPSPATPNPTNRSWVWKTSHRMGWPAQSRNSKIAAGWWQMINCWPCTNRRLTSSIGWSWRSTGRGGSWRIGRVSWLISSRGSSSRVYPLSIPPPKVTLLYPISPKRSWN